MSFFTALKFLTSIPFPWRHDVSPEELGRSLSYYPLVGLVIGGILAGLSWLFRLVLPAELTSVLLIVSLVIITGALHLDGFADTCDGIAGHKTVEARWQVMHDSRTGAFGVVGIVLLLLTKYVSLSNIPDHLLVPSLLIMPVISRWAIVYGIFTGPYARPSGLGKVFKESANWRRFSAATLITLIIILLLAQIAGLVIMFFAWVITVILVAYFRRKFAGLTGDTYGAINEIVEVSVLISVILLAKPEWLWWQLGELVG